MPRNIGRLERDSKSRLCRPFGLLQRHRKPAVWTVGSRDCDDSPKGAPHAAFVANGATSLPVEKGYRLICCRVSIQPFCKRADIFNNCAYRRAELRAEPERKLYHLDYLDAEASTRLGDSTLAER